MKFFLAFLTLVTSITAFAAKTSLRCDIDPSKRDEYDAKLVFVSFSTAAQGKAEFQYIAGDDERYQLEQANMKPIGTSLYFTDLKGAHMMFIKSSTSAHWPNETTWEGTLTFKHYKGQIEKVAVICDEMPR